MFFAFLFFAVSRGHEGSLSDVGGLLVLFHELFWARMQRSVLSCTGIRTLRCVRKHGRGTASEVCAHPHAYVCAYTHTDTYTVRTL